MKKIKLALVFSVLVFGVMFLVSCQSTALAQNSYVTIDINPSVELIVTPRNKVIHANPLNEDAEVLLVELDLIGLSAEDAIDIIIETAIELGYISVDDDVETVVSVNTINKDLKTQTRMHKRMKEHINKAFVNKGMLGRAKDKEFVEELINEADSYGITVQLLILAKEAALLDDELLLEDAVLLSKEALLVIIQEKRAQMRDVAFELREEFHAARDLLFDTYHPQLKALHENIIASESRITEINEQLLAENDQVVIDLLNAEIITLSETIETLKANIVTLRTELHEALVVIREEFHTASMELKDKIKESHHNRRNHHKNAFNNFKDHMKDRRHSMWDRIKDFQNDDQDVDQRYSRHCR